MIFLFITVFVGYFHFLFNCSLNWYRCWSKCWWWQLWLLLLWWCGLIVRLCLSLFGVIDYCWVCLFLFANSCFYLLLVLLVFLHLYIFLACFTLIVLILFFIVILTSVASVYVLPFFSSHISPNLNPLHFTFMNSCISIHDFNLALKCITFYPTTWTFSPLITDVHSFMNDSLLFLIFSLISISVFIVLLRLLISFRRWLLLHRVNLWAESTSIN